MGAVNCRLHFVLVLSDVTEPRKNLLHYDVVMLWSDKCEQAFNDVKHYLTSPPLLTYFRISYLWC